jgi:hypothetical protein
MQHPSFARSAALAVLIAASAALLVAQAPGKAEYRTSFPVDKAALSDRGAGAYFVLEPGYTLHFQSGKDTLVVSVLDETKVVDGVTTRVVEERETEGGRLAEVSRNYFAIDKATGDVYYFGEAVDEYTNGKVTGHGGAWLSGVNGASFGLMVPGDPRPGDRYYQESAPKVAMDRAEVISVTQEVTVPAGVFKNCLRTKDTSALESGSEDKYYAPGVGLIKDAEFVLVRIEKGQP